MLRSLLILLLFPALSLAQKGKFFLAGDVSYGTKDTKAGAISAGFIKNGFLLGVGIGIQKSEYQSPDTFHRVETPRLVSKFVEVGYMKPKKPFILARAGEASISGEAYIGGLYLDGKIGVPFEVGKILRIAPFISATHFRYTVHPEYSVAPLPNKTIGFGLLLSTQ